MASTRSFLVLFFILRLATGVRNKDDASALPNLDIDLDSFYYDRAVSPSETTLLASTLDGTLVAINQNGEKVWEHRDQPAVKSPYDASKPTLPAFLPDPKDGSIYMIGAGLKDPLKKLPFTIPELVAASPCKSSDGILYTGKKVDTWFSVNRYTGFKQGSLSFNGCVAGEEDECPNLKPANILIGRTEYNVMMYDSRGEGRRWNISFFEYSSNMMTPTDSDVIPEYEFAHFTDSSTGSLMTLDRNTGKIQWELQIGSPVVAMYRMDGKGIASVPFTSVSKETLNNLMDKFNAAEINNEVIGETKLFPTLYVGEHDHGLFAMPSLVDEQTLTISPSSTGPLLLEGPQSEDYSTLPSEINLEVVGGNDGIQTDPLGIPLPSDTHSKDKSSVLLFGYYQVPEHANDRIIKLNRAITHLQLTSQSPQTISQGKNDHTRIPPLFPAPHPPLEKDYQSEPSRQYLYQFSPRNTSLPLYDMALVHDGLKQLASLNTTFLTSIDFVHFVKEVITMTKEVVMEVENKELKLIAILLGLVAFALLRLTNRRAPMPSVSSNNRRSQFSIGSTSSQTGYEVTANPIELENGNVKVGNITYEPDHILGKGCEGTFVYKGRFDNRDVAVKRVLAACFSIADREVDLLRESDEHPNVIRYFCMEQDRQFRYIALELCCATLQDYVESKYQNPKLDPLSILRQATRGLAHLHTLDIAHRDVKPHNVLISMPGKKGDVRAMISDFGLCKKLKVGRMSFSRRSGVAGTEGWIAPEMMLGNRSTTCAVDIFSLGCVYYYVLSKGHHPFGESFRRQANILQGEYNLDLLTANDEPARSLIEKMINPEMALRPSAAAVLKHPLFWSKEMALNFLQDVSDRVDKEDSESALIVSLERHRAEVTRGNWHDMLDPKVSEDLRKHRTYNGKSVRDLLRALRNKKHHYNELQDEIKALYGRVPDQYASYWMTKFPKLLIFTWRAMHSIKKEPTFVKYFDKEFDFLPDDDTELPPFESVPPDSELADSTQRSPTKSIGNGKKYSGKDFFEPEFLHQDDDHFESQGSVVSNWDNLDSAKIAKTLGQMRRQSRGLEEEEFADMGQDLKSSHPYPLIESPLLQTDGSLLKGRDSPRIRRKVVQLDSDAKSLHQQEMEEWRLANKPTWAEAVQNISPEQRDIDEAPTTPFCDNNTDEKENCDPADGAAEQACDAEDVQPSHEPQGQIQCGNDPAQEPKPHEEGEPLAEAGDKPESPVWILPPEEPKQKKKKKKKPAKV